MSIRRLMVLTVTGVMIQGVVAHELRAQCEVQKLTAPDGTAREYLGFSLDLSGDVLVAGAPNNTFYGPLAGRAYVYRFNGVEWAQQAALFPARTDPLQMFGTSVSVFGDDIMVGAPNAALRLSPPLAGGVYPYRFDGSEWVRVPVLAASDSSWGAQFGWSVDLGDGIAVVGAPWDGGFAFGAAYVFRFHGADWIEEAKLLPSSEWSGQRFGWSVGVDGNTVVVGGLGDGSSGIQAGAAYVFRFDGSVWTEEVKLAPADLHTGDEFGRAVAISGNTILVGAPGDDDNGGESGSAYVFRFDGLEWIQEAKLRPTSGAAHEYFGFSAGLSADTAVVGAHFDGGNGAQAGAAYVFYFNGVDWTQQDELFASDGAPGDYLGRSVAVSGSTVMVAAPRDNDHGTHSGSAYVFGACPDGVAAAVPDPTAQQGVPQAVSAAAWRPARSAHAAALGGGPGMGAAAAALVREDRYTQFLDQTLQTHFGDERGIYGAAHFRARDQIAAAMSSFGLTVTLDPFIYRGETYYNVVGTKTGTTFPDEEYVIGAHYDSVSNGGVDDNASGVALVLETARVLSRYESQRTMRFMAYSAEEVGLVGSRAYASAHIGDNILGMISPDMVAYNDGTSLVNVGCGSGSLTLESSLGQAVSAYGAGLHASFIGSVGGSDHYSFESVGFEGCYFAEHELTPYYHTLLDNFDFTGQLDYAFAAQLTRIIVGFLVDNAGIDTCAPAEPVTAAPETSGSNRFLTVTPPAVPQRVAIRVKLASLNHPDPALTTGVPSDFSAYEDEYRWVGPPTEMPEFNEVGPPYTQETWMGAMLQCEPYFTEWDPSRPLSIYGAEIMPDSTYEVQTILEVCADGSDDESLYSPEVIIATRRWGDVAPLYAGGNNPPQPDFVDVSTIVKKFMGALDPLKVEVLLRFNVPPVTENVDFRDIAACVAGFVGEAYPNDGPCTCPSAAACPDLDVCERCTP